MRGRRSKLESRRRRRGSTHGKYPAGRTDRRGLQCRARPGGMARRDAADAWRVRLHRADVLLPRSRDAACAAGLSGRRAKALARVFRRDLLRARQPVDSGHEAASPAGCGAHDRTPRKLHEAAGRALPVCLLQRMDAPARLQAQHRHDAAGRRSHGREHHLVPFTGHADVQRRGGAGLRAPEPAHDALVADVDSARAHREQSGDDKALRRAAGCGGTGRSTTAGSVCQRGHGDAAARAERTAVAAGRADRQRYRRANAAGVVRHRCMERPQHFARRCRVCVFARRKGPPAQFARDARAWRDGAVPAGKADAVADGARVLKPPRGLAQRHLALVRMHADRSASGPACR